MASKRPDQPWPRFDDLPAVEGLAKNYPPPDGLEWQDRAACEFHEAADARRLARWFSAAADALLCHRLPADERRRLASVVALISQGPSEDTPKQKRLALMKIISRAARYVPPAPSPAVDDPPGLDDDEAALTPQQRRAQMALYYFRLRHPEDAAALSEPAAKTALLEAVKQWSPKAGRKVGQRRGKLSDDERKGKYYLLSKAIEGTSFHYTHGSLRKLWEREGEPE